MPTDSLLYDAEEWKEKTEAQTQIRRPTVSAA